MMPGQEMYYKLKPTDNILLQSDMSKHVDAKPFNPGGNPMQMAPPRPGMFKPGLYFTSYLDSPWMFFLMWTPLMPLSISGVQTISLFSYFDIPLDVWMCILVPMHMIPLTFEIDTNT